MTHMSHSRVKDFVSLLETPPRRLARAPSVTPTPPPQHASCSSGIPLPPRCSFVERFAELQAPNKSIEGHVSSKRALSYDGTHIQRLDTPDFNSINEFGMTKDWIEDEIVDSFVKNPSAPAAAEPVKVLGVGSGGVDELRASLNDRAVAWALLRFQVGSGTFARTKFVVIQCNGADVPAKVRGLLKGRSGEVLQLFGETHASMDLARVRELTTESVCQRVLPLFGADDLGNYSASGLQEEYAKMLDSMQSEAQQKNEIVPKGVKMFSTSEALRAVGEDRGNCNWVLLDPANHELFSTGDHGLDEMKRHLQDDKVLFGVLRLSFANARQQSPRHGCAQASVVAPLTKYVFVHWVGSQVSIVKRGRLNAQLHWAVGQVSSCCAVAFRREAFSLNDLRLEDLIEELRRKTGGASALRMTCAGHVASLQEEIQERQEKEKAHVQCQQPARSEAKFIDIESNISVVRATSGQWNWVLCGWQTSPSFLPKRGGC